MKEIRIDKFVIDTPIEVILKQLRITLTNGKLREIRNNTDNLVVTCPFHGGGHEHRPDCNIYIGDKPDLEYGYFRCFACDACGSFVEFVRGCFDSSLEFAKDWLIQHFGKPADSYISLGDPIVLNRSKKVPNLDKNLLEYYQDWHPYMAQRKLSKTTCKQFQVKYDPYYRQILFPCFDERDNLVLLPKRSIDTKMFYIDKDRPKPLYCYHEVFKNNYKRVMIVEGLIDTLSGWEHGIPTVGTMGNPSDIQINQLNRSGITVVYCAFDNDSAGQKFTQKVKQLISPRIIVEELKLPPGVKDVNDMSEDQWKTLIEHYDLPQIKK
jgi:DNA primase